MKMVVAGIVGTLAAAAPADIIIQEAWASQGPWNVLLFGIPSGNTSWTQTGGNPGGCVRLSPTVQNATLAGVGYQWFSQSLPGTSSPTIHMSDFSEITMSYDVRWQSGQPARIAPLIRQGNYVYFAADPVPIATTAAWINSGEQHFFMSDFARGDGTHPDPNAAAYIGFGAYFRYSSPSTASGDCFVDNISMRIVVPSAPSALGLVGLVAMPRKRRRDLCKMSIGRG